jgi:tetratricopeptide (TPR) repeat protein
MLEVIQLMKIAMRLLVYPEDSIQILEDGERLAKELQDEISLASIGYEIGVFQITKQNVKLGIDYLETAFSLAKAKQNIDLMAPISLELCFGYCCVGYATKVVEILPHVLDLIEKTERKSGFFGSPLNLYSVLCALYGCSLTMLGDIKKGKVSCEKGLVKAEEIGDLRTMAQCELYMSQHYIFVSNGELAKTHIQRGIEYYKKTGWIFGVIGSLNILGQACHLLNDLENAKAHLIEAIKIQKKAGIEMLLSWHYWALSEILFDLGEFDQAANHINEGLRLSAKHDEIVWHAFLKILFGRILEKQDPSKINPAEDSIQKGISILDDLKMKSSLPEVFYRAGEFYIDVDRPEKAKSYLNKAEALSREMEFDYWMDRIQKARKRIGG